MRVGAINNINPSFGIFKKESITAMGDEKIITTNGQYKDKKITIYNEFSQNKKLAKLIYISDVLGNFLKLKLFKYDVNGNKQTMLKQAKWG